ncbi:MAG: hypothetical protein ACOYN0_19495 [Phycisphaerales bacterium]
MNPDNISEGAAQPGSNSRTENQSNKSTSPPSSDANESCRIAASREFPRNFPAYFCTSSEKFHTQSWCPCPHRVRRAATEIGGSPS